MSFFFCNDEKTSPTVGKISANSCGGDVKLLNFYQKSVKSLENPSQILYNKFRLHRKGSEQPLFRGAF